MICKKLLEVRFLHKEHSTKINSKRKENETLFVKIFGSQVKFPSPASDPQTFVLLTYCYFLSCSPIVITVSPALHRYLFSASSTHSPLCLMRITKQILQTEPIAWRHRDTPRTKMVGEYKASLFDHA